jgi:hypothetical protein
VHSVTQVERRETTNVTFAHSLERVIDDVKMLMLMLLLLVILAGGSHSWEPETSSVALTSSEYAFPQSPLLLSFLVMVAVTAAAAVWASHRHLSRTAVQYASHSQSPQRQHMLFECPFSLLCLCVVPFYVRWASKGWVGLSSHSSSCSSSCVPLGACSSSAGHCCAPSFAVEVIIVDECRISVPCGAALLLLLALNICCHSRTCGCLACTLRLPYVCFVPRAVVSVDGWAQCAHTLPLVASHAQLQVTDGLVYIDELFTKRYFSSLFLSRRAQCRDNASRSVGQWRWRWRR